MIAAGRVYDDLIGRVVPAVESIKWGDPSAQPDVEMGPLISKAQQERVYGFLERCAGTALVGGGIDRSPRGFFVEPTLIADVAQADEIVQREVFGPVVTVQRFGSENDAMTWANDVEYGLAASIWTRDVSRAHSAIRKLRFGTVWVNDHLPFVSEMPWGGLRQSGYGHDLSSLLVGGIHAAEARYDQVWLNAARTRGDGTLCGGERPTLTTYQSAGCAFVVHRS